MMLRVSLVASCLLLAPLTNGLAPPPPPSAGTTTTRRQAIQSSFTVASGILVVPTTADAAADSVVYQEGPEGLQYVVTEQGTGDKPQRAQRIQTSYTLYINGFPDQTPSSQKIDSSRKPLLGEQPFKVRAGVKQVIRGWDLALMDMRQGEARRLVVPPNLAYGDKGIPGAIPPKATLYFEMKLVQLDPIEPLSPEAQQWLQENPL